MTAASLEAAAADAGRDAVAMLRARHEGRHGDTDAILDAAGADGTRAIACTLAGMTLQLLRELAGDPGELIGDMQRQVNGA